MKRTFSWLVVVLATASIPSQAEQVDLRANCRLSGLLEQPGMSVTWTGECSDGRASGVGEVYAFVGEQPIYILRGMFLNGALQRTDSLRDCRSVNCLDDIAPAIVQRHRQRAAATSPAAAQPPTPAPVQPSLAPAVVPVQPLPVPATPPQPATASVATVPEREIRVANAVFRGRFSTDPRDGAISGEGRVEYNDGATYEGRIERGIKQGQGVYVWAHGMRYSGQWQDDRPHGQGVLSYPNGDVYEGEFLRGERTGRGTLRQRDGSTYTGDWLNGVRQGSGVAVFANGQRYEGEWRADRRHGLGTMTFPDGARYEGDWVEDRAVGRADIVFPSGDAYTGEVRDGLPHGQGVYRWGSGDRFDGEFANGKPTERGTMTFMIDLALAAATPPPVAVDTPAAPQPVASAPAAAPLLAASPTPAPVTPPTRQAQCFAAFNAARTQQALQRFLESFPEDECGRHALAKEKLAAIAEREKQAQRALAERQALARTFIGATVAFEQDFPFCVVGSGADCQRVTYSFRVQARIQDIDVQRRTATVQVQKADSLGPRGATTALFAQGRAAATEAFRARVVGQTQTRTLAEIGLAF